MESVKADARTRILEAAAEIVGRECNLNLTVREIAARANVNVASINYYFRSKENLLTEVEGLLMEDIAQVYSDLRSGGASASEKLAYWADSLISHLINCPGIIYLIGTRVLEHDQTGLSRYLSLLESGLYELVAELAGTDNEKTLGFKVLQLVSGVVYPVLIYSSTEASAGVNIDDKKVRAGYVDMLIKSICSA